MTNPLSLQPSLGSNRANEVTKTNQRLKPAYAKMSDLPAAIIWHAMGFLPFADVAMCKRVFKLLSKLDFLEWTKRSGHADFRVIERYFQSQCEAPEDSDEEIEIPSAQITGAISKMGPFLRSINLENHVANVLFKELETEDGTAFFPNLTKLRLDNNPEGDGVVISDKTLDSMVLHAPKVTHLAFDNMSADTLGDYCQRFAKLESVSLEYLHPCGSAHKIIERCPKLKELILEDEGNADLEKTAKIFQLTKILDLSGSNGPLTDEHLKAFKDHPNLQELVVSGPNATITEQGVRYLADVPRLQHLTLRSLKNPPTDLSCLAGAKALKKLTLQLLYPTLKLDTLIASLKSAKNIEELKIIAFSIFTSDFAAIGMCTHVRSLEIGFQTTGETITDQALAPLASCQELRSLTMYPGDGNCDVDFTTQGMISLVRKLPHLQFLDVGDGEFDKINADKLEEALLETHPQLFVKKDRRRW